LANTTVRGNIQAEPGHQLVRLFGFGVVVLQDVN
jgi:hypothetical protein